MCDFHVFNKAMIYLLQGFTKLYVGFGKMAASSVDANHIIITLLIHWLVLKLGCHVTPKVSVVSFGVAS